MGFRTVVINSQCKLSYKNDYLQVKGDELHNIHLSEVDVVVIESTQVNITAVILAEFARRKIKVVFCDERHNPYGELVPYYGCHNTPKKIAMQIRWHPAMKEYVSDVIIKQKIVNQAMLLKKYGKYQESEMLFEYADALQPGDRTNREGHAAKVYFNALFGKQFSRESTSDINAKLDYGYSILLSCINREVVSNGCLTQLGIKHTNEFNQFNLSCDIIEMFRVLIDEFVMDNIQSPFDIELKHKMVNILNRQVFLDKDYYLTNAIGVAVKSVISALNDNEPQQLKIYQYK